MLGKGCDMKRYPAMGRRLGADLPYFSLAWLGDG
jgi:hypothetical protein